MEQQYIDLVKKILEEGELRDARNGRVYSVFGGQHTFDLREGFPLLTTKKIFYRGVIEELLFFIRGSTQTKELEARGVNIWRENTSREFLNSRGLFDYAEGEMGPMYGFNWRFFGGKYPTGEGGYDQFEELVRGLRSDPHSRRHLLTTYDPTRLSESVLPPCHGLITQFYVSSGVLHCHTYQRSVDVGLGYPFNIASYGFLLTLVGFMTDLTPGKLTISFGDAHIYAEHVNGLREQILREIRPPPRVRVEQKKEGVFRIVISGYAPHPTIKLPFIV